MEKEWFTAMELAGIAGLPKSTAGVHDKARREEWERRRKQGVQGKALEYAIESLPPSVLNVLRLKEKPAEYVLQRQDPLAVWVEAYYQLTDDERQQAIAFLLREGIDALMKRLV